MVASLLRVKDNFCIYSECEKTLRDAGKITELVLLMKKEAKHETALDLLLSSDLEDKIEQINDYLATVSDAFEVTCSKSLEIFSKFSRDFFEPEKKLR